MIGVFDSGFGGLTVLKELLRVLPRYDYIYLGDSARAPYGSKSPETIYEYTRQAVEFLFEKNCQLVVLACNSASAGALRKIQQEWLPKHYPRRRVLGVIIPVVEAVADINQASKVGVIGTRATLASKTYQHELRKISQRFKIYEQACPLLVPLIEEGWAREKETGTILKKYLKPLQAKKIDTLILGCTHYPILLAHIKKVMGKKVKVLDSPRIVAIKLADYLKRHPEIEKKLKKNGKRVYFTTDDPKKFKKLGRQFLRKPIRQIEKIHLHD
jgi:glutamate racemase